jgi:hypothetical protein
VKQPVPPWWNSFGAEFESPETLRALLLQPVPKRQRAKGLANAFFLSLHLYFVLGDGLASATRAFNLKDALAAIVLHKCGVQVLTTASAPHSCLCFSRLPLLLTLLTAVSAPHSCLCSSQLPLLLTAASAPHGCLCFS